MFDMKKLKQAVQTDDIQQDTASDFSDVVEGYATFGALRDLISLMINSEDLGIKANDFFAEISEGLDDEDLDRLEFRLEQLLRYIKVPDSVAQDLLSEDDELSQSEFENVRELLIERIGDNSIDEFIAYALHNTQLDEIDYDNISYDWAFFPTKSQCNQDKPDTKNNVKCMAGYHGKMKGFWRYPKDFNKSGSISASYHTPKAKGKGNSTAPKKRIWGAEGKKSFKLAIEKRVKTRQGKEKAKQSSSGGAM